jgi:hypothetical protein
MRRLPKKGRPRIEDRAKTNEAKKPWLKLDMSRWTWYRLGPYSIQEGRLVFTGEQPA